MIYLVSDIHGCYYSFLKLLKKIKLEDEDILICLGDLIDRGKWSFELLDYFMTHNNFKLIKGNHELFMDLYFNNILLEKDWWKFGGQYTISSLKRMSKKEQLKYYNYIHKLPLYIECNNYVLTHSGFNANFPFIEEKDLINVTKTIELQYKTHPYNYLISGDIHYMPKKYFDKQLIVGHVPTLHFGQPNINYGPNCIDIDCGATYKNGKIGCLRLDDMEEFYVKIDKLDMI